MNAIKTYIDHTLLKAEATEQDIKQLCKEAATYGFYAVCVNSCYVELAARELSSSDVKIASVVGFPLGACTTKTKVFETEEACRKGASEIDMVLNVGKLKSGDVDYVKNDIASVVDLAAEYRSKVKVILETCLLSDEEIVEACELAVDAGAYYVKTSTGFGSKGATAHHVELMRKTVGPHIGVKASGGIRDYQKAKEMIDAGADRIGASASIAIMKEAAGKE